MRINALTIKNFKGIPILAINAFGKNVNIYGDNATGKTTIADAFNWLINDKDSLNRKDFGIKPIDPETQEPIHGIETEVEAVLDLGGNQLTLKKKYYENWVKERGAAEKTFKGNTTDYFIDDVPVKKSEYEKRIAEIADEKAFKLLTNPLYFNEQLHWTERRKMIIQVCGDVSDDEVIEANTAKLSGLKAILGTHDVESHKKLIAAKKAEINKELEKIPARITEVKGMMPDTTGIIVQVIENDIAALQKQQDDLQQEKIRIQSGGEIAEKNKRLSEIDTELNNIRNSYEQKNRDALGDLLAQETAAEIKLSKLQSDYFAKQNEIEACGMLIKTLESEIETLYEKYDTVEAEKFTYPEFTLPEQAVVCPTCGQPIPEEQLESARSIAQHDYEDAKQKSQEAFNLDKSNRLEKITSTGKETRAALDKKQKERAKLEVELADLKQKGIVTKATLDGIRKQIETAMNSIVDLNTMPEYKLKCAEQAQVLAAISELRNGNYNRITEIQAAISNISKQIADLQAKINSVNDAERFKARIEELKADEKRLAAEYERLESELFTVEEFIRTKVKMLDTKINSKFKYVRFKLFNAMINGALEECCEALINTNGCWAPYSDANAAGKINGGIDIINTLSEFYNFEAPIFVDNAESVVDLAETRAQAFRLIVSGQDKTLRIETEEN